MEDAGTISRVPAPGFEALQVLEVGHAGERSRGAERWAVLRRLLALGDLFAGLGAGMFAALVAGVPTANAVVLAASAALLWPALAFACGLYSGEDLRSWVSGVSETPRLLTASLVFSWPLFGFAWRSGRRTRRRPACSPSQRSRLSAALAEPARGGSRIARSRCVNGR